MSTAANRAARNEKLRSKGRPVSDDRLIGGHYREYRVLSFAAVLTILAAIITSPAALLAHANPALLVFPLLSTFFGANTLFRLRRRQDEFIGLGYARIGVAIALLVFCAGTAHAMYTYATEVPDGYERVSFAELQPAATQRQAAYSQRAAELADKKVFVKGYVYPDGQTANIKQFVLVPDMGTCCFGGQPKLTDMIQVTLNDPLRTEYSFARRSFGGTFRVAASAADKVGTVIYHLDADYAK